jgi:tetratricopeptide (TPR) repeat protein
MIRSAKTVVIVGALAAFGYTGSPVSAQSTPPEKTAASDKSAAYYNFAMGHLYAELAGAYNNRSEYVNKAIDFYKQAMKLDPGAGFIFEELTDLYIQTGHLRDAVTEAQDLLKRSPDNVGARKILGRIYYRMIGDPQQGKINEDMLKQAIEQYKQIAALDPKDVESWLTLGRLYRVPPGDSVEAEKTYKHVIEIDPNNEEALTGLAMVYSDAGDTRRAIEMLRQVTDRDPSANTLEALAQAYDQVRDYKSAAEVLRKAVEMAPDKPRLKRELARNLLLSDQFDEALKLYNGIAAEDPKDPEPQIRLSEIYRQRRSFDKARAALDKARSLDSDNLDVRYEEVNLLADQGKTDEAITTLKGMLDEMSKKTYSAAERGNRVMLLERLGILYRTAAKYQEAADTFRQIGELDPDNASKALVMIIDTWRTAKDYKKALAQADAALKQYPDERIVKLSHASVLADMGKVEEGVSELRALKSAGAADKARDREIEIAIAQLYDKGKLYADEAKALDAAEKLSESPQDKLAVNFQRGAMYEREKKYDLAESEFRKVLATDPDNPSALNYLGYMFAEAGIKLDEAAKLISRALQLDPQNGAYLDSLGWVYYRQNRLPEAENLLVQALERIGKDPTVHDHLGDIYFKQGKTRDAIIQWQASLQEYEAGVSQDMDSADAARINKKLESAKIRLAQESGGKR